MLLRASTSDDRRQTSAIRRLAWQQTYRDLLPAHVIEAATSPKRKRTLLVAEEILKSRVEFVAEEKGRIVGFVAGGLPRDVIGQADCELWAIYVDPHRHSQGLGRKLFERFRQAMREQGRKRMILWALEENQSARRFYERMGGELLTAKKPFHWEGQELAQEIAYVWNLLS
jgi:GNAT superfamily N-acetyltransferase